MKDWKAKCLGELLKIQNGYAFDSKKFSEEGVPLIRIRDIKKGVQTEICYRGEYDKKYLVKSGDFLIGMDGEFRCYEWKGIPSLLNQRVCRLQDFSKELDPKFLFHGINKYLRDIEEITGFTTVKHISSSQILSIRFPIPPIKEQRRIVALINGVFDGIASAAANAEKNIANARELLESYLRSALSRQGKGWKERTLKQVSVDFGRGKSKHRPRGDAKLLGGPYPLIQTGDVANSNHWITSYSQTYSEVGLAQSKLWPKGTVCIAIVGANVAETSILGFDACFPDSVIGLVVDDELADNEYVEFLLQTFKAELKQKGKGTARDNINMATFEDQTFPFPDVLEQRKIVAGVNEFAEHTRRMEAISQQKIDNLAELRRVILQRAFAGQLTAQPEKALQEAFA
jgi:type I restriction enzyme S subunit